MQMEIYEEGKKKASRTESASESVDLAQEDLWQSLVYLPFIPNVFDKLHYR